MGTTGRVSQRKEHTLRRSQHHPHILQSLTTPTSHRPPHPPPPPPPPHPPPALPPHRATAHPHPLSSGPLARSLARLLARPLHPRICIPGPGSTPRDEVRMPELDMGPIRYQAPHRGRSRREARSPRRLPAPPTASRSLHPRTLNSEVEVVEAVMVGWGGGGGRCGHVCYGGRVERVA